MIMRKSVVFPAPFGPTRPTFSPGFSWNEASTNRTCLPYCLLTLENEIMPIARSLEAGCPVDPDGGLGGIRLRLETDRKEPRPVWRAVVHVLRIQADRERARAEEGACQRHGELGPTSTERRAGLPPRGRSARARSG